jgi:hypothetical protein
MTDKETIRLALDALEESNTDNDTMEFWDRKIKAIAALKDRLAQPEQEPVAWIERDMQCDDFDPDSVTCEKPTIAADGWEWIALYTTPPQRKPLTDEQIWKAIRPLATTDQLCKKLIDISMDEYRAIEAAHGIKENT